MLGEKMKVEQATDFHRHTVYHDADFHQWMQFRFGPLWEGMPFRLVRRYAKSWNFVRLYSNGVPPDLIVIPTR